MAGSLSHIVEEDGRFTTDLLSGVSRDTMEALAECHQIIAVLLSLVQSKNGDDLDVLQLVCRNLAYPAPEAAPVIQIHLHGANSLFRQPIAEGKPS